MKTLLTVAVLTLSFAARAADEGDFEQRMQERMQKAFAKYDGARHHVFSGAMLGVVASSEDDGAEVMAVTPGSAAERAGLKAGDVLVSIDGVSLARSGSRLLSEHVRSKKAGDTVQLEVQRGKEKLTVSATLEDGAMFKNKKWSWSWTGEHDGGLSAWNDVQLVALNADLGSYFGSSDGLLVVSAPAQLQLKGGDVVLKIGDRVPKTASQAVRMLASYDSAEKVPVEVLRQKQHLTLTLQAP